MFSTPRLYFSDTPFVFSVILDEKIKLYTAKCIFRHMRLHPQVT